MIAQNEQELLCEEEREAYRFAEGTASVRVDMKKCGKMERKSRRL